MSEVNLRKLLSHFHTNINFRNANLNTAIEEKCIELLIKDYDISIVYNRKGQLCSSYPERLLIIENSKENNSKGKINDTEKLQELFEISNTSRVRNRFPIPVILYKKKNICRSSTLSQKIECISKVNQTIQKRSSRAIPEDEKIFSIMDYNRGNDIQLIKELKIRNICDLMVEDKKKKYFLKVASSEKVDSFKRYSEFTIASLPYPGCEFFRIYKDNKYNGDHLYFPWDESHCKLQLSSDDKEKINEITKTFQLNNYTKWDLCEITQYYLKTMIYLLVDDSEEDEEKEGEVEGLLVHCISGWDRTPMFISLLRISLWADGLIHQSLSVGEMLFFTIAYDWLLFHHDLPDRSTKGEDIFYFCFDVLFKLQSEEFSVEFLSSISQQNFEKRKKKKEMNENGKEIPSPIITSHLLSNSIQIFSDYSDDSLLTSPSLIIPIQSKNKHNNSNNNINKIFDNEEEEKGGRNGYSNTSFDESYGRWEPKETEDCMKVTIHSKISIPDLINDDYSDYIPNIKPRKSCDLNLDDLNHQFRFFTDFDETPPKSCDENSRQFKITSLRDLFLKTYRPFLA